MKGKNLTRTLSTFLLSGVLFTLLFSFGAFALEPSDTSDAPRDEAQITDTSYSGEAAENGAPEDDANSTHEEEAKNSEISFFAKAYEGLFEKAPEITSLLAFIGSLIVMFSYKRGFMPLVSDGIKALAGGVKSISDKADALEYESEEFKKKTKESLDATEKLLLRMESSLKDVEERLKERENEQKEKAELKSVLLGEIEMLYEIFMSAALPQYLKDSVGEKMAEIRRSAEGMYTDEN